MKVLATVISILIALSAQTFANETEKTLEDRLERRINTLTSSMKKFKEVKKADVDTISRDKVLQKVAKRIEKDTVALNTALEHLNFYMELQELRRTNDDELRRTQYNIASIKAEMKELRKDLAQNTDDKVMIAAK